MEVAIAPKSQPVVVQSQLARRSMSSTVTTESAATMPSFPVSGSVVPGIAQISEYQIDDLLDILNEPFIEEANLRVDAQQTRVQRSHIQTRTQE